MSGEWFSLSGNFCTATGQSAIQACFPQILLWDCFDLMLLKDATVYAESGIHDFPKGWLVK
jgi:hypothetical protein